MYFIVISKVSYDFIAQINMLCVVMESTDASCELDFSSNFSLPNISNVRKVTFLTMRVFVCTIDCGVTSSQFCTRNLWIKWPAFQSLTKVCKSNWRAKSVSTSKIFQSWSCSYNYMCRTVACYCLTLNGRMFFIKAHSIDNNTIYVYISIIY